VSVRTTAIPSTPIPAASNLSLGSLPRAQADHALRRILDKPGCVPNSSPRSLDTQSSSFESPPSEQVGHSLLCNSDKPGRVLDSPARSSLSGPKLTLSSTPSTQDWSNLSPACVQTPSSDRQVLKDVTNLTSPPGSQELAFDQEPRQSQQEYSGKGKRRKCSHEYSPQSSPLQGPPSSSDTRRDKAFLLQLSPSRMPAMPADLPDFDDAQFSLHRMSVGPTAFVEASTPAFGGVPGDDVLSTRKRAAPASEYQADAFQLADLSSPGAEDVLPRSSRPPLRSRKPGSSKLLGHRIGAGQASTPLPPGLKNVSNASSESPLQLRKLGSSKLLGSMIATRRVSTPPSPGLENVSNASRESALQLREPLFTQHSGSRIAAAQVSALLLLGLDGVLNGPKRLFLQSKKLPPAQHLWSRTGARRVSAPPFTRMEGFLSGRC
jgi:hypothetical protein